MIWVKITNSFRSGDVVHKCLGTIVVMIKETNVDNWSETESKQLSLVLKSDVLVFLFFLSLLPLL